MFSANGSVAHVEGVLQHLARRHAIRRQVDADEGLKDARLAEGPVAEADNAGELESSSVTMSKPVEQGGGSGGCSGERERERGEKKSSEKKEILTE